MSEKTLVAIDNAETIAEGEMRTQKAGPFEVLVCRVGGELHAVENKCSHQARPLHRGRLRGHRLICPVHGAAFDVRDGNHKSPPAMCGIESFPVIASDDGWCIEVPSEVKKPPPDPFGGAQMVRVR